MKVFVVTGWRELNDGIRNPGGPLVFRKRGAAEEAVRKEYEKLRQENADGLSQESLDSWDAIDQPPNSVGARFMTDDGDVYDWTIDEIEVDQEGVCLS